MAGIVASVDESFKCRNRIQAPAVCGLATTLPRGLRSLAAFRLDMHVLVIVAIAGAAVLGEWSEGATVAALFAIANARTADSARRDPQHPAPKRDA
jgi:cation transport ATPase